MSPRISKEYPGGKFSVDEALVIMLIAKSIDGGPPLR